MHEQSKGAGGGATVRQHAERAYLQAMAGFTSSPHFASLESGQASRKEYDGFLLKIAESHLLSGHFIAFGFAIAPPKAAVTLQHNLEEELGTDGGTAHPALLTQLLRGAGLGDAEAAARRAAQHRLRDRVMEPLFYGSLREVGLAALTEIFAFEYLLSRLSSRIAAMLATHRDLDGTCLEWFTHHSEVDIEHAEQGLDALAEYVDYYAIDVQEALDVVDAALEENVFLKHYFGAQAAHTPSVEGGR